MWYTHLPLILSSCFSTWRTSSLFLRSAPYTSMQHVSYHANDMLSTHLISKEFYKAIALFNSITHLIHHVESKRNAFNTFDPWKVCRQAIKADADCGTNFGIPFEWNAVKTWCHNIFYSLTSIGICHYVIDYYQPVLFLHPMLPTNINGTSCIDLFLLTDPKFPVVVCIFSMCFIVEHDTDGAGNDLVVTIIQFADDNIIVLTYIQSVSVTWIRV